jgi:hypothetical protein
MTIYYLMYLIYFLFSYFSVIKKYKFINKSTFLLIILLILIASLRYETGTDFHAYLSLWQASTPLYIGVDYRYEFYEVGFRYLTSFIKMFGDNSILYFFSLSFISISIFYISIKKYYLNLNIAIFMYFCLFYLVYVFNAMGQAIVMSIFLFTLEYFFKKNTFKILSISVISMLIHKSGIFIMIAYLGYRVFKKIKIDYMVYIGIPLMLIVYKLKLLILLFSNIFPNMAYTYMEIFSDSTSYFQIVTRIVITLILFYFYKQFKNNDFYKNIFLIYLFGLLLYIGFSEFNILATRINMFFRITEILLFANILMYTKNLFTKNILFGLMVIIYTYSFYVIINNPYYEYKTIF